MPGSVLVRQPSSRMKIIKDGAEREDDVAGKDRRDDGPLPQAPDAASEIRAVLKTSVGSKQTFTIPKRLCVFSAMALTSPSPGFMMTFAVTCRKMPSAELVVFPGVGHGLMYQCPDRFCETVLGFLK